MISNIYADNLVRSNSDLSRGIAGRSVAMKIVERDLRNAKCHYCNKLGHYKNDCTAFKVFRRQDQ